MASLNEVSGIPKSIEENSGRSATVLTRSSALKFQGISHCSETEIINLSKNLKYFHHSIQIFTRQSVDKKLFPKLSLQKKFFNLLYGRDGFNDNLILTP